MIEERDRRLILTVEDQQYIRTVLCFHLKKAGFDTIEAGNGREAYDKAKSSKPDIIIMDIMMPGDDGFKGLELLKSDEETRDIPVIMLTSMSGKDEVIKASSMGAFDYILKPFEKDEVIKRVNIALNGETKKTLYAETKSNNKTEEPDKIE